MKDVLFSHLDLNKTMHYKNGSSITFKDAITKLAISLKYELPSSTDTSPDQFKQELEKFGAKIGEAIKNYGKSLVFKDINNDDKNIAAYFHKWIATYVNDNLIRDPAKKEGFPDNILFDMRQLASTDPVVYLFLEGANARKLSKGFTPSSDFVSSSLMLTAGLELLKHSSNKSEAQDSFKTFEKKYEGLKDFITYLRNLEDAVKNLGANNNIYPVLMNYNPELGRAVLDFEKSKNDETGGNIYYLENAFKQARKVLDQQTFSDEAFSNLKNNLLKVSKVMEDANNELHKRLTPDEKLCLMWDMSEWFGRAEICAQVLSKIYNNNEALEAFNKIPLCAEIINRSLNGDFPANEISEIILALPLLPLFMQEELSKMTVNFEDPSVSETTPLAEVVHASVDQSTEQPIDPAVHETGGLMDIEGHPL